MATWQYLDDHGTWRNMLTADNGSLEALFRIDSQIKAEIPLGPHGLRYGTDLAAMEQINLRTGLHRQIRRLDSVQGSSVAETVSDVTAISETLLSEVTLPSPIATQLSSLQLRTPRSSHGDAVPSSPTRSRSSSLKGSWRREYRNTFSSQSSLRFEPSRRAPGPATYDKSKHGQALSPRGSAIFGSARRNTSEVWPHCDGPSPQDYCTDGAWQRSSSSRSSSSARMRSPRKQFLLRGDRVILAPDSHTTPGPSDYDTRKYKQALSSRSSATFGRTVRLVGQSCRTPTSEDLFSSSFLTARTPVSEQFSQADVPHIPKDTHVDIPLAVNGTNGEEKLHEADLDQVQCRVQNTFEEESDHGIGAGSSRRAFDSHDGPRELLERPSSVPPERTSAVAIAQKHRYSQSFQPRA